MEINKPTVGIFGSKQNGKSTLANCALSKPLAKVGGNGMSVTDVCTRYTYGPGFVVKAIKDGKVVKELNDADKYGSFSVSEQVDEVVYEVKNNVLKEYDLLDTPGLDANEQDTEQALNSIEKCDFAILVLRNKGISQTEKHLAKSLYTKHIPFVVLVNCFLSVDIEDSWFPTSCHNKSIGSEILAELKSSGITPFVSNRHPQVLLVNLIWEWISLGITYEGESIGIKSAKRKLKNIWGDYFGEEPFALELLSCHSKFYTLLMLLDDQEFRRQWYLWKEFVNCNSEINQFMESMKRSANAFESSCNLKQSRLSFNHWKNQKIVYLKYLEKYVSSFIERL